MSMVEVKVPDIGDVKEVEVIELMVKVGDTVKVDQSLITVESDKASMEIPSNQAGVIKEIKVKVGDKVSEGSLVLVLEAATAAAVAAAPAAAAAPAPAAAAAALAVPAPVAAGVASTIEIKVPDIGDVKEVDVIEVMVKVGDVVKVEQSLITVESDKASMEIPSSQAGVIKEIKVKVGDKVGEGSVVVLLETTSGAAPAPATAAAVAPVAAPVVAAPAASSFAGKVDIECDTVVLGAGPGGYTAAFRAADLGQSVVMIERYPSLGGVCLNVGCIPSKALLHAAKVITEAEEMAHFGVKMSAPEIDIDALRGWKESVIKKLTGGLSGLAKARKVQVVTGKGAFSSANTITVETADGPKVVGFKNAIIAAGSSVARIPGFPYDDPRLIDSTGALELRQIPKKLLVIGGGIIGLEMACVYDALGSKVTVVEFADGLIPAADRDVVKPLQKRIEKRYEAIYLKTKVTKLEALKEGLRATFEGADSSSPAAPEPQLYDMVLVAVGRRPNGKEIAAEKAGVIVNERGFIPANKQQRTNVSHIFAIGDICGDPMLAHKATNEAKVAAEVIAGHKVEFDAMTIPSVAYTDPEIAWMGLTETEAKAKGIPFEKANFPWAASGRALAMGRDDGMTKLLWDPSTKRIIGAGIVGVNAGELLAETVLAMEMGADLEDLALTIHAHPTLSETPMFAAEMGLGTITDLFIPKKK
ncbi:Dihydrolipoamide dehydrogenase of pyruvate dehydrogenase complex [Collimonas arenae]|uniref:Dihydrolipoyl dehydrogenase n=1 Tax=Collimonas arenae TaxID=279058 RepID=A0A0A1FK21_9BURK|nr:dihydrolipoyl dehydrogenase [Collimonas arenae]AIY43227.1 Dihydrolipoamide dehydrogenase of pyruvate dehydrogenase complex [Collimonas arenae]